ncbi:COR1 (YBL045C) [Zygosaccharomyces parabailii]|uniref:ZYBA0S06-04984g1_1 n=1 Tax=Zygosaccharomyces bailii (strain CLIB 213 / ATCC 58445 / CBS 680 / BCRC 21525 / NBRC 1098 / NCYC 1416 / NRRL Y-2227) TaxID=1333698 RepID=A0A8J2X900_ZYGB2|nr:COR1 (YBL045C) [Zygosaccharomyces parabailii]CDF90283.1 ZYBA0S06-04984g1_1 [Zygosaccharomyces bailii CLIB 213]CDH16497.1 probable COR1-Ubiquinol--cytochrome-c reductase 44K core protein [Zygosaccharomyces bailii ISA1307]SJM84665.1 probable Cytochrome b-c1 complex subunit 1, mitochondrial [Zygosaccharomyces bailii]
MLRSSTVRTSQLLRRTIATQAAPKAEFTELSNGIKVATEHYPDASSGAVGIVFGSGSAAENPYNNGVSNIWSHVFTGTKNAAEAAKAGLVLNSHVSRDYQSYLVSSKSGKASQALEFLQSKLTGPLDGEVFEASKASVLSQVTNFEGKDHAGRVQEHLHSVAFQNTPLSLPVRGTVESVETLVASDLHHFAKNNFLNSNAVIVGSGNVSHDELVRAVESHLSLPTGERVIPAKKSTFLGSEVRMRDDTLPKAWISIAAEGEPVSSPDFLTSKVAAEIFGDYNAHEPASRLQGVKLIDWLQECGLCDTYHHFSHGYKDAGLWGFSVETSNIGNLDDLVHFTLKQWNRLTVSVTESEVARGKALLKLKLAHEAQTHAAAASLLGASALALDHKPSLDEAYAKIDKITSKDIKEWASKRLWDQDIAIAATGQIEGLFDYTRIRNDMSMMRW